jgi:hypothetical protein
MNKQELYGEVMELASYEEATSDYCQTLSDALDKFSQVVRNLDEQYRPGDWNYRASSLGKLECYLCDGGKYGLNELV